MRALITGGAGFVGRVLGQHLADLGDEVISIDRSGGGPDIVDRPEVFERVRNARADVIYHLAAQAHVPSSWEDPVGTLRSNAEGTLNVLDAAHDAGSARVLVVSSAEVYGSVGAEELPIDEDKPLRPTTPYAASKVAADAVALQCHLGRGQDVLRMRAFNHIGPGQRPAFVCAGLAQRIAIAERDGTNAIDVGSLDVRRDFTDVRDVVRAYRLAAEAGVAGAVYNVCSGVDRSIREIAELLIEISGRPLELITRPDLERPVDTPIVRGSYERLHHDTGWSPEIPLGRSLTDILDDARERLHDLD